MITFAHYEKRVFCQVFILWLDTCSDILEDIVTVSHTNKKYFLHNPFAEQ